MTVFQTVNFIFFFLQDVNTGEKLQKFEGHDSVVSQCHMNSDTTTFISGSWDKTCKLWDVETGQTLVRWFLWKKYSENFICSKHFFQYKIQCSLYIWLEVSNPPFTKAEPKSEVFSCDTVKVYMNFEYFLFSSINVSQAKTWWLWR